MLDVGATCEITVEAGQIIVSGDTNKVTVSQKDAKTWVVTAKEKGDTNVQVRGGDDQSLITTIDVHVNNQAPTRGDKMHTDLLRLSPADTADVPSDYEAPDDADPPMLYKVDPPLNFADYFSDKDGDSLKYTATSSAPRNAVVAAIDGDTVLVDLLNNVGDKITIEFTATDSDADDPKSAAGTLSVEVQLMPVRVHTYTVVQFIDSGTNNFSSPVEVGFRQGQEHILKFSGGFEFAGDVVAAAGQGNANVADVECQAAGASPEDGNVCYVITKSGSVTLGTLTYSADHDLPFTVTGPGLHTVTVAFKIWANDDDSVLKLHEAKRTLQLRVEPVTEQ
jgi:hypothetical protein